MHTLHLLLVVVCVFGISLGQVLFKLSALSMADTKGLDFFFYKIVNPYLAIGLLIYLLATILWVWLLRFVPLNVAYPFMALAFFLVPLLSTICVGEPFGIKNVVGGSVIILGVYIVAG